MIVSPKQPRDVVHNQVIEIKDDVAIIDLCYHREYTQEYLDIAIKDAVEWLKFLMKAKNKLNEQINNAIKDCKAQ